MKILIASDIHGSFYYAKKVNEAFETHQCDRILLLGDLLYHGPRNPLPKEYNPKEVIPLLNGLKDKIIAVRGNCDAEVDQMVLEFPIMEDATTISIDDITIFASHGHIYHPENLPNLQKGNVFIFGHIHIPVFKKQNDIYIVNPGSITLPKENTEHSYMVYENKTFTLYNERHEELEVYHI